MLLKQIRLMPQKLMLMEEILLHRRFSTIRMNHRNTISVRSILLTGHYLESQKLNGSTVSLQLEEVKLLARQ